MQTFLPYPDYQMSASVLDYRRLGKQRVECKQILLALDGTSKGWKHHPAVNMWRNYEYSLCCYALAMCNEWVNRGYKDKLTDFFRAKRSAYLLMGKTRDHPPWIGVSRFHESHKSNLMRKDPDYYNIFWALTTPPDIPYVWPTPANNGYVFI